MEKRENAEIMENNCADSPTADDVSMGMDRFTLYVALSQIFLVVALAKGKIYGTDFVQGTTANRFAGFSNLENEASAMFGSLSIFA
jgi:hypothetical protein